ncbi:MAG: acetylglutamate kinase [Spirochaetaceae bacterium]|jgi:acetylglutamate kinase|nr:acetylglutamate kinase [Spirochaetaceae bacterium]
MKNEIIVVKYGGNAMINDSLKKAVIEDVVEITQSGKQIVLVHGGGPEIDTMLRMAGITKRVVNGLRYTCEQTMNIVQMVLCGKINKELCALILRQGGNALGLCGIDGALLRARRISHDADGKPLDLGLVGEITHVNTAFLYSLLQLSNESPCIPVISPVAFAEHEPPSSPGLNVNADTAAAKIAAALNAPAFILMTDVPGILRDVNDEKSLIGTVNSDELETLRKQGILCGGMIPKTECCRLAIDGGVGEVRIIDGRVPHALRIAVSGTAPIGTIVRK